MLAYVAWHRPAAGVNANVYERSLQGFHRSLRHVRPSGFERSAAFRIAHPPWLRPGADEEGLAPSYEDWYLVDSWSALGVLEEAAVGHGHVARHDEVAAKSGQLAGAVYRLSDGHAELDRAAIAVWVDPARGHAPPAVADLLADGADSSSAGLWRRCLVLGPAPEYCLLAPEPPAGASLTRLPAGWTSMQIKREAIFGRPEGVR